MAERREDESVSSSDQLRAFIKTDIWTDLSYWLKERIDSARQALEQLSNYEDILRTQGAVEELRLLLHLPESLAADAELIERKRRETKKEVANV